jgi:hypothetical protein
MEYKLIVRDVDDGNRKTKYLAAVDSLAKAMKVPVTLKPKSEHQERFPYQSYEDLVQKWTFMYAGLLDRIYEAACHAFDLPRITTFSKAIDADPLIYKGKILYSPETGRPISQKQWREFVWTIERFLNRGLRGNEERLVLDAAALGKVLDRMLKFNSWEAVETKRLAEIEYWGHKFEYMTNPANFRRMFGVGDFEAERIKVAEAACAQYIRDIDQKTKSAISQSFISGVRERKSKSEVAQDLFDRFGGLNRDWQRIVETEINENMNTAFLLSERSEAKAGEKLYFQRIEMRDEVTCAHCVRIRGIIALWSNEALDDENIKDPFAKVAIWEGKTRVGKRANDDWVAAGSQHPWCRGSWARWLPPVKAKTSLLDAAMAKMRGREELWGKAVAQTKAEFEAKGARRLDDTTPGYRERINELFQQFYRKSAVNDDGKWAEDWFNENMPSDSN